MTEMTSKNLGERYKRHLWEDQGLGAMLDISRMNFPEGYFAEMQPALSRAFAAMVDLEAGKIANPDESRMVGHYWLRAPELAPNDQIKDQIKTTLNTVKAFVSEIHKAKKFTELLVIGIGGSALGPQLVSDALGISSDKMKVSFVDNTDPDGIDRALASLKSLSSTLNLVISKSGGTRETKNGQILVAEAYRSQGLKFSDHAVAITGVGSALEKTAQAEQWLKIFPMWDWVGGRTSELSAVGLLPAALQGLDIDGLLEGARKMDCLTRIPSAESNPAARLALMWYHAGKGQGQKAMVVLPYKDRLLLMSRYLQQLVMESLGKKLSLSGEVVHQGLSVFGNKGSTDQHAYVQQLRDGRNDFFAIFIEVLKDQSLDKLPGFSAEKLEVAPGVTAGDYLRGFMLGTRDALWAAERESITLTLRELNAESLGAVIALFERAVGFYATLINVNAYHQPGVEAGKVAAESVISLEQKVLAAMAKQKNAVTAQELADQIGEADKFETVFKILLALAANGRISEQRAENFFKTKWL